MRFRRRPKAVLTVKEGKEPGTLDIDITFRPNYRREGEVLYSHKTALVGLAAIVQALSQEESDGGDA